MDAFRAVAGIDPTTKLCEFVGQADDFALQQLWAEGLIIVPVTPETARALFGQAVEDIYAIADTELTRIP